MTEIPYVPHPLELPARYAHGPDSFPQPNVPRGTLHAHEWNDSRVFPGTQRNYWVYVPAQYDEAQPASLMVFQDAEWYLSPDLNDRAVCRFDNLIHQGAMPVTIGVFVSPGEPEAGTPSTTPSAMPMRRFCSTRSSPPFGRGTRSRTTPSSGRSAAGAVVVCAFTVGWMRRPVPARHELRRRLCAATR